MTTDKMIAIAIDDAAQVGKITNQLSKLGTVRIQVLLPKEGHASASHAEITAVNSAIAGAMGALLGALLVGVTMAEGAAPLSIVSFPFAALASMVVGATIGGLSGWPMLGAFEDMASKNEQMGSDHFTFVVITADEFTIHKIQKMVQKAGSPNHLFLDQAQ